jgi:hypothetical protein
VGGAWRRGRYPARQTLIFLRYLLGAVNVRLHDAQ